MNRIPSSDTNFRPLDLEDKKNPLTKAAEDSALFGSSDSLHLKQAGDIHIPQSYSKTLSETHRRVPQYDIKFRPEKGFIEIKQNTIIEGSAGFGGQCPDILFQDFIFQLEDGKTSMSFLDYCKKIAAQDIPVKDKILVIQNLVTRIITEPVYTNPEDGKRYYGRDYAHPKWQSHVIQNYRNTKKPAPIGVFAAYGFGDCRITNGLLAFGLRTAGFDAHYDYLKVMKFPRIFWARTISEKMSEYEKNHPKTVQALKSLLHVPTEDHAVVLFQDPSSEEKYVLDAYFQQFNGHSLEKLIKDGATTETVKRFDTQHKPTQSEELKEANKHYRSGVRYENSYPNAQTTFGEQLESTREAFADYEKVMREV